MLLELQDIRKSFGDKPVLRDVSLGVAEGDIVVLLGPSGCGKTTLLRIIAGLERADGGQLILAGEDLARLPVHQRGIGMVFQDFALFPHKNVTQNVEFGLRMMGWDENRRAARVSQILGLVGLQEFADRSVYDLSGGEQQRVALARSLAPSPRLLLLDEPLGSLDRALRERLMGELRSILKRAGSLGASQETVMPAAATGDQASIAAQGTLVQGITSIYVTHDQEEAFAIADRVMVMNEGRIEQKGTPVELYNAPRNPFVARFLGMDNLLDGQVVAHDPPTVKTALGRLTLAQVKQPVSSAVVLLIRPEAGKIVTPGGKAVNLVQGRVERLSFRGRHQVVTVAAPVDGDQIRLKLAIESAVPLREVEASLTISLDPAKILVLECC